MIDVTSLWIKNPNHGINVIRYLHEIFFSEIKSFSHFVLYKDMDFRQYLFN